jgi:hypothetical protein
VKEKTTWERRSLGVILILLDEKLRSIAKRQDKIQTFLMFISLNNIYSKTTSISIHPFH